jgi:hypothetical protein
MYGLTEKCEAIVLYSIMINIQPDDSVLPRGVPINTVVKTFKYLCDIMKV